MRQCFGVTFAEDIRPRFVDYDSVHRYPNAISFLAGLPANHLLQFDRLLQAVPEFRDRFGATMGCGSEAASSRLLQYGRTIGTINELVAIQAANDHGIVTHPENVILTSGCQEAIGLALKTLCSAPDDVVLARNPTYIGVTGAAAYSGVTLLPLDIENGDSLSSALRKTVIKLLDVGKRPRVIYLIPEFDNPTGDVLPVDERLAVLDVCFEFGIFILEDNAYELLRYEGSRSPTMAALDEYGLVIYLGTYSKVVCPGIRVGFVIIPERAFGSAATARSLLHEFLERKSYLNIGTSQLSQAVVGGILSAESGSLARFIQPAADHYRRNRDLLLAALDAHFKHLRTDVHWNRPHGGFFLSMQLPFVFDQLAMLECAERFDVLVLPMSAFALDDCRSDCVRLSFSYVAPDQIEEGAERLLRFVEDKLAKVG